MDLVAMEMLHKLLPFDRCLNSHKKKHPPEQQKTGHPGGGGMAPLALQMVPPAMPDRNAKTSKIQKIR